MAGLYNTLVIQQYPKRMYARTGGSILVQNSVEEKALGPTWTDFEPEPMAPAAPPAEAETVLGPIKPPVKK